MAEWSNVPDSKSGVGASPPWVRIPPSPPVFQMPREGHCCFRREVKSLRTSRGGFEGLGMQAKSRPAGCRRISLSPPVILKTPTEFSGRFSFRRRQRCPCGHRVRDSKDFACMPSCVQQVIGVPTLFNTDLF